MRPGLLAWPHLPSGVAKDMGSRGFLSVSVNQEQTRLVRFGRTTGEFSPSAHTAPWA